MAKRSTDGDVPKQELDALDREMAAQAAEEGGGGNGRSRSTYHPKGDPTKEGVGGATVKRVQPRNQQPSQPGKPTPVAAGRKIQPTVPGATPPQSPVPSTPPTVTTPAPPPEPEKIAENTDEIRAQVADKNEGKVLDQVRQEVEASLLDTLAKLREYEGENLQKWSQQLAGDVTTLGLIELRLLAATDKEKERLTKLRDVTRGALDKRRAALTRLPEFYAQTGLRRGAAAAIDLAERLVTKILPLLLAS